MPGSWNPRCDRCRYFDTSITDEDGARSPCRVTAPTIPFGARSGTGEWPMVEDSDWCGLFHLDPDKLDDADEEVPA